MPKQVTREVLQQVIRTREPKGWFYGKSDDIYIAVDNETGDAWTEEFDSEKACKKWLSGYPVKDAHGYLLND